MTGIRLLSPGTVLHHKQESRLSTSPKPAQTASPTNVCSCACMYIRTSQSRLSYKIALTEKEELPQEIMLLDAAHESLSSLVRRKVLTRAASEEAANDDDDRDGHRMANLECTGQIAAPKLRLGRPQRRRPEVRGGRDWRRGKGVTDRT